MLVNLENGMQEHLVKGYKQKERMWSLSLGEMGEEKREAVDTIRHTQNHFTLL